MAVVPVTITSLDYEAMLDEAILLAQKLLPDWDVTNVNDPGRFVMEVFLAAVARGNLFVNQIANEFTSLTAQEDRMMRAHAKSVGYTPATATPSATPVDVETDASAPEIIPQWSLQVSSKEFDGENARFYENAEPISVITGPDLQSITFREGRLFSDSFVGTGQPFQRNKTTRGPFIRETTEAYKQTVTVAGEDWAEVSSFVDSAAADKHYVIEIDSDDKLAVLFGDGVKGASPTLDATVIVTYRTGGGVIGKVLEDKLTSVETATYDFIESVNNPAASSGGTNKETIEQIRAKLPIILSRRGQLNNLQEIAEYAEEQSGVDRAKVLMMGNTIYVYVISDPVNTDIPQPTLDNVETAIEDILVMGYSATVVNPYKWEPPIEVTLYASPHANKEIVRAEATSLIRDWINPLAKLKDGSWKNPMGGLFRRSLIGFALQQHAKIYDYVINQPLSNIETDFNSVAVHTGPITITVITGMTETEYFPFQDGKFPADQQPEIVRAS